MERHSERGELLILAGGTLGTGKEQIGWTNTRSKEGNDRLGKTLGNREELIGW